MALKTIEQYYESLKNLHPITYILGQRVEFPYEHPLIKPMITGVAQTYALAHEPEGRENLAAKSRLIDEKVSRFNKFYESCDDLLAKVRMLKFLIHRMGTCFMRCTGMDAINTVGIEVYNCDQKYGTNYWERLLSFVRDMQREDLVVFSGVIDVKGDRSALHNRKTLTCI